MKSKLLMIAALMVSTAMAMEAKGGWTVKSPDGKLMVSVSADAGLSWEIRHGNTVVLEPSGIVLKLSDGREPGRGIRLRKAETSSYRGSFDTPFYKKSSIRDEYNALVLRTRDGYDVEFRVYDDGAAYRFMLKGKNDVRVDSEKAEFNFAGDYKAFLPYITGPIDGERYTCSFESYYTEQKLSEAYADSLILNPLLVCLEDGKKAAVIDGGVEDYPGMFLVKNPARANSLVGEWAPYPLEYHWGGLMEMDRITDKRADYIAKLPGTCTLPWRGVIVSENDVQLADNDMIQKLASPCRIGDTSWIRPGKVAWDWWNTTNITGVDFKSGMNTDTYKYFIDFASANGIEYIIVDCGWSGSVNDWKGETLMYCIPEIDIKELCRYGEEKNVGVILWACWAHTDVEMETVFPHYAAMGVKGFKVDFLDVDDQPMNLSMYKIAECAAKYHLLIDFHGTHSNGIFRTWPNVVNIEGVKGMENCKWSPRNADMPRYDLCIPFIRMLGGPMDYTPGSVDNATRDDFRARNDHPMSMGTRCHQLAMYTIFEAPLQMLSDSPSAFMREQESTDYIASVPTCFDETLVLNGEIGEYVTIARRKGETWWIGSMTDWTPREFTVDLSFLPEGTYDIVIYKDGVNAGINANDYRKIETKVTSSSRFEVSMAPGGGWAARITPSGK